MPANEKELLSRAQAGDSEALGELLIAHQRSCYWLALRLTGNDADAEDVCQEAFARAASSLSTASAVQNFRAWLLRIVVCAHRNRLDSEQARKRRERSYAMERPTGEAAGPSDLERDELRSRLNAALKELQENYRLAIVLHYEQGLSSSEAAAVLALPEGTIKTHIARGLEELRRLMTRSGYTCAVPAMVATLQQPPAISAPASLTTFIHGLKAAGAAKAGAVTATGATGTWVALKIAAVVMLAVLAGVGGLIGWRHLRPEAQPAPPHPTAPVAAEEQPAKPSSTALPDFTITPRGADAWEAFDELAHNGLKVVMLDLVKVEQWPIAPLSRPTLNVQPNMRFKPVAGRDLVEAVAAAYDLKVAWVRNSSCAVLYEGASDPEIADAAKGLASANAAERRNAASQAGWLIDVRIVPLLVKATRDADAEVARQAVVSLQRMRLDAIQVLDENAADIVAAELNSPNVGAHRYAVYALRYVTPGKALPLLKRAMGDPDECVRYFACDLLANLNREDALPLLDTALSDNSQMVRAAAAEQLKRVGSEKILPLIQKAFSDEDGYVRDLAVEALVTAGNGANTAALLEKAIGGPNEHTRLVDAVAMARATGERALPQLEEWFGDKNPRMRWIAVSALGQVGGEKVLGLLRKALVDDDGSVRRETISALANIGGNDAFALIASALKGKDPDARAAAVRVLSRGDPKNVLPVLESALADPSPSVRYAAGEAFAGVGEWALALLQKALLNADDFVRREAVRALARIGGEQAKALLINALDDRELHVRWNAAIALGEIGGEKAIAPLQKALSDEDVNVRRGAAEALGKVGSEKALGILEQVILDHGQDDHARWAAVSALRGVGGKKAWVLIESLLMSHDPDARFKAFQAIEGFGKRAVAKMVAAAKSETDKQIREKMVFALSSDFAFADSPAVQDALKNLPPLPKEQPKSKPAAQSTRPDAEF